MTTSRPAATERFLREQARSALQIASGGVRTNACDPVSNEFAYTLEQEFDITAHSPVRAPFVLGGQSRKHFVALIPADETAFATGSNHVIVDATVKQFEDSVDEDLPEIAIIPPGDSRRNRWYGEIRSP